MKFDLERWIRTPGLRRRLNGSAEDATMAVPINGIWPVRWKSNQVPRMKYKRRESSRLQLHSFSNIMHGLWAAGQNIDNPCALHLQMCRPKVPLRFEGPVCGTRDPVTKTINIQLDLLIDLCPPRRQIVALDEEPVHSSLEHRSSHVYRRLEIHLVLVHD